MARLPTVLLFAGTGWLMFSLTRELFGPIAGLWSVVALNLTPFFTVSAGGWIVPDGPLSFFLLAAIRTLAPMLLKPAHATKSVWRSWLLSGLWLGLGGLSKYTAAFAALGLVGYLASSSRQRHWFRHPAPFAAGIVALLAVSPALVWNAQHQWVSFAFQGARGLPHTGLHPLHVVIVLAGECALLAPWIAVPATLALVAACRGVRDEQSLLLIWLSIPCILFFTVAPLWSAHGMPHWSMPGWLFAIPLLGRWIAADRRRWFSSTVWVTASSAAFAMVLTLGVAVTAFGLPVALFPNTGPSDPTLESLAWSELRLSPMLQSMQGDFVVTTRWMDAGKIAMALGRDTTIEVFSNDPRQFAFGTPSSSLLGHDATIIVPARYLDDSLNRIRPYFEAFDRAEHVPIGRSGRPELDLVLIHAHRLQRPYPNPYTGAMNEVADGTLR